MLAWIPRKVLMWAEYRVHFYLYVKILNIILVLLIKEDTCYVLSEIEFFHISGFIWKAFCYTQEFLFINFCSAALSFVGCEYIPGIFVGELRYNYWK